MKFPIRLMFNKFQKLHPNTPKPVVLKRCHTKLWLFLLSSVSHIHYPIAHFHWYLSGKLSHSWNENRLLNVTLCYIRLCKFDWQILILHCRNLGLNVGVQFSKISYKIDMFKFFLWPGNPFERPPNFGAFFRKAL